MDWLVMVLRVVHIGGAVFWAGSAFTFFVFVAPSLEVLSPPSRKAFLDEFVGQRRFATVILVVATLTILAGAALYWRNSGGFNPSFLGSAYGLGFTVGGLAGLAAWLVAAFAIRPTFDRLGEVTDRLIAEGRPPSAEEAQRLASLGGRLRTASRALLGLLFLAVLLMSISRYLT